MSVIKKKIGLVCHSIEFTRFSIIYKTSPEKEILNDNYIVVAHESIKDKDLILKPTVFNKDNRNVIFTPSNVTPAFYLDLINKKIKDSDEYSFELDSVYKVGDTVAYVLV